ncbi:TPA: hypothetical protein MO340_004266 [Salmonella enterica subsp. salamae serovar 35:g,m,s,t:-]|nr:hypothetical protein [Salmonella enterica subsp. salamae serovar 35:g,m,s,t:-]HCA3549736.1 hypothetical protein [Salmonella enterica subsp. salamae serovar 35:g,m,s,t:-]
MTEFNKDKQTQVLNTANHPSGIVISIIPEMPEEEMSTPIISDHHSVHDALQAYERLYDALQAGERLSDPRQFKFALRDSSGEDIALNVEKTDLQGMFDSMVASACDTKAQVLLNSTESLKNYLNDLSNDIVLLSTSHLKSPEEFETSPLREKIECELITLGKLSRQFDNSANLDTKDLQSETVAVEIAGKCVLDVAYAESHPNVASVSDEYLPDDHGKYEITDLPASHPLLDKVSASFEAKALLRKKSELISFLSDAEGNLAAYDISSSMELKTPTLDHLKEQLDYQLPIFNRLCEMVSSPGNGISLPHNYTNEIIMLRDKVQNTLETTTPASDEPLTPTDKSDDIYSAKNINRPSVKTA